MSASRLTTVMAIVRKDVIILWPLVLASLVLPVSGATFSALANSGLDPNLRIWAAGLGFVATGFLTLSLFHQDPATDNRHDWLTRPITSFNLLLAKGLFLILAVVIPLFVATVIDELVQEHSAGEAFLAATLGLDAMLILVLPFAVLGIITSTLVEALIALVAPAVVFIAYQVYRTTTATPSMEHTGLNWISDSFLFVSMSACVLLAVWFVYARKAAWAARIALAAAVALLIFNPMKQAEAFALATQRAVSSNPAVAAQVQIVAKPLCKTNQPAKRELFRSAFAADPSPSLLFFSTDVVGLPADWRVMLDRETSAYLSRAGDPLGVEPSPSPVQRFNAPKLLPQARTWAASGGAQARMAAQGAKLRLRHDITLLKPIGAVDLTVDAPRRYYAGFGYCSAARDMGRVSVKCFSPILKAAVVTASAGGATAVSSKVSYRPALFPRFGVSQLIRVERGSAAPGATGHVRLTAYSAEAQVSRTTTAEVSALIAAPTCPGSNQAGGNR